MIEIIEKRIVNKPIEEVWKVVSNQFTEVGKWATGVYRSRPGKVGENSDRVCDTSFGIIKEKILLNDHKNYTLKYNVKGFPFFVTSAVSTWNLRKISKDKTEVTISPKIKTMVIIGSIMEIPMKKQLKKIIPMIADEFVMYTETGKLSNKKQEELKKRS